MLYAFLCIEYTPVGDALGGRRVDASFVGHLFDQHYFPVEVRQGVMYIDVVMSCQGRDRARARSRVWACRLSCRLLCRRLCRLGRGGRAGAVGKGANDDGAIRGQMTGNMNFIDIHMRYVDKAGLCVSIANRTTRASRAAHQFCASLTALHSCGSSVSDANGA